MATFTTTRRVEFADTDMAGIVHFAAFFRYMESAEHEFLRSRGLSVTMERDGGRVGFPRVSASCDFQRPARFEDVLTVAVTVKKVGRSSVGYGFEFLKGDEPLAAGQLTTVFCHKTPDGRWVSAEIPADVREKLTSSGV